MQNQNMQPSAPSGTEELSKLKLDKVIEKHPSFSTLKTLSLETLTTWSKSYFDNDEDLRKQTKAVKASADVVGKMLAAMLAVYNGEVEAGRQKGSFSTYCESKGITLEHGRAQQCCRVFRRLVETDMLPESDYDQVEVDWLTIVSRIIGLADEQEKSITSDEVLDAINVLKTRPKKGAAQLRGIKNRMEGKETVASDGKGRELDAKSFQALVQRGLAIGRETGLTVFAAVVFEELTKEVKAAGTAPENVAREMFTRTYQLGDAWQESGIDDDTLNAWSHPKEQKPEVITETVAA